MRRAPAPPAKAALRWAEAAIFFTAISCVQFVVQVDLGFSDQFDYTQAVIRAASLALGFAASIGALWVSGVGRRPTLSDYLLGIFILSALGWSWRSWNPGLSAAHTVCYAVAAFNARVVVSVVGVRRTLWTLYITTCLIAVAGIVAALIAPERYPLFTVMLYQRTRERLTLFQMHPILVADLMVLNLIVGLFLKRAKGWPSQSLCATILLCTASRASIACGAVIITAAALSAARRSGRWRNALIAAIVLVIAGGTVWFVVAPTSFAVFLFPTSNAGELMTETVNDHTLNGRFPLWEKVVGTLSADNFMGSGFYGYRKSIYELSGWAGHAHNIILDAILVAGYGGAFSLLAYIAYALLRRRRAWERETAAMCRYVMAYTIIVGMLGPTLLDSYMILYVVPAAYAERRSLARDDG